MSNSVLDKAGANRPSGSGICPQAIPSLLQTSAARICAHRHATKQGLLTPSQTYMKAGCGGFGAGRQTGSEGWRAARGELGTPSTTPAASTSTAYQLAGDDAVADSVPRRLCGGVVRASGEHQPHQTAVRVSLLRLHIAA